MQKDTSQNKLKPMLIIVIVFLVLAIGTLLGIGFSTGKIQEAGASMFDSSEEVIVPLEQFLVNLTPGESNKNQYLQIELSLYSDKKDAEAALTAKSALIRDAVISVLRSKTADSLYTTTENGDLILKEELRNNLNSILGTDLVNEVYITNIVTQ